eukprot:TRINITY_DN15756_c0_g1_i3.p1 TRINITY_DN15756_c0_g1~~TRINITY_DN15756_c0_g1_i3.p1  ORF type:complete len:261 (-),score=64.58 TRINITY_DN15756_c0_g1_i3:44-826(-)
MEADGFTLVSKGKNKKKHKTKRTTIIDNNDRDPIDVDKVIAKIETAVNDLKNATFFTDISSSLKNLDIKCEALWCFGLGHLGDCITARFQFALLILLRNVLGLNNDKVFLCDPIFYEEEIEIIKTYNFNVATENIECMLECSVPTFLFLPHCPKQLSNNLLFSNWSPNNLQNLVIFSNSFNNIVERTSTKMLAQNASYIVDVLDNDLVTEIPVTNSFKFNDVFNDLAIHTFTGVDQMNSEFWKSVKPVYDLCDTEFIMKS